MTDRELWSFKDPKAAVCGALYLCYSAKKNRLNRLELLVFFYKFVQIWPKRIILVTKSNKQLIWTNNTQIIETTQTFWVCCLQDTSAEPCLKEEKSQKTLDQSYLIYMKVKGLQGQY